MFVSFCWCFLIQTLKIMGAIMLKSAYKCEWFHLRSEMIFFLKIEFCTKTKKPLRWSDLWRDFLFSTVLSFFSFFFLPPPPREQASHMTPHNTLCEGFRRKRRLAYPPPARVERNHIHRNYYHHHIALTKTRHSRASGAMMKQWNWQTTKINSNYIKED